MNLSAEERMDLHDRYARYILAMDSNDVEALVQMYTADGVLVISGDPAWDITCEGHDQIRAWAVGNAEDAPDSPIKQAQHRFSNLILTGGDGHARGICYLDWVGLDIASGQFITALTGMYIDEWTLVGSVWSITRRELRLGATPHLPDAMR